ncbi:MAG: acylphosphatase [Acidimicrobiia bacterium]
MTNVTARQVRIHGRVHGVGFRAATVAQARVFGLQGWVANRPDGTVEAQFEGPSDAVAAVVGWCAAGPRLAVVDWVEELPAAVEGWEGFVIR